MNVPLESKAEGSISRPVGTNLATGAPAAPDFGVVICTCKFDFFLAKACVASVRYSLGDVPITLFIDDEFDAGPFARRYGVNVMHRRDVRDPWLRTTNTGWGLPKMTLFWESPYEHFLYLDCDTIVWGDLLQAYLQPFETDMVLDPGDVHSRPWSPGVGTDQRIRQDYFDPEKMESIYPAFPWRKYRNRFFCTGVYAARRNCLSLAAYKDLWETRRTNPGLFSITEMPLLNFLIFDAVERGELKVRYAPLQMVCDWDNQEKVKSAYRMTPSGPDVASIAPTVLHFTDPKPLAASRGFNEPMEYFRRQCARDSLGLPDAVAAVYTRLEEVEWRLRIAYRRNYGGLHSRVRSAVKNAFQENGR